jgi:nicotinate phosphoribosyltransferase
VRARLNEAGLTEARIMASNELDENIVRQLITQGAPIDAWGVGTNLVTGGGDPALSGVYKLAARQDKGRWVPTIKVSNNPEKVTNPGVKQVWRFTNGDGGLLADLICLDDEAMTSGRAYTFHHPMGDYRSFTLEKYSAVRPLLGLRMRQGKVAGELPDLAAIQAHSRAELDRLDDTYKRLINPHLYKVSLSDSLNELKARLIRENLSRGAQ